MEIQKAKGVLRNKRACSSSAQLSFALVQPEVEGLLHYILASDSAKSDPKHADKQLDWYSASSLKWGLGTDVGSLHLNKKSAYFVFRSLQGKRCCVWVNTRWYNKVRNWINCIGQVFKKAQDPPLGIDFLREVQFLFRNPKWRECNSATMQIP